MSYYVKILNLLSISYHILISCSYIYYAQIRLQTLICTNKPTILCPRYDYEIWIKYAGQNIFYLKLRYIFEWGDITTPNLPFSFSTYIKEILTDAD